MQKQVTNVTNTYLYLPDIELKPKTTIILQEFQLSAYMLDRLQALKSTNCIKVFDINTTAQQHTMEVKVEEVVPEPTEELVVEQVISETTEELKPTKRKTRAKKQEEEAE